MSSGLRVLGGYAPGMRPRVAYKPPPSWLVFGGVARAVLRRPRRAVALVVSLAVMSWTSEPYLAITGGVSAWALPTLGEVAIVRTRARVRWAAILSGLARRRAVTRRAWLKAARAVGLVYGDGSREPLRLSRVRITAHGLAAVLVPGQIGRTADYVGTRSLDLAAALGIQRVTVREGRNGGIALLELQWTDPLADTLGLDKLPKVSRSRLAYGVTDYGSPASFSADRSVLIAGLTGSGKSSLYWAALASARKQELPVRLRVVNPKGVELNVLEGRAYDYAVDAADAVELLERAVRAMHARKASMAKRGIRRHKPTRAEPLDVTLIDELLVLTAFLSGDRRRRFEELLGVLLTQGRALGFVVWAAAQAGQIDVAGRTRTFFGTRLVLATDAPESTDAALGRGASSRGADAHRISLDREQGIGFAGAEDSRGFTRFRAVYLDDAAVAELAGHIGTLYPPPPRPAKSEQSRPSSPTKRGRRRASSPDSTAPEDTAELAPVVDVTTGEVLEGSRP